VPAVPARLAWRPDWPVVALAAVAWVAVALHAGALPGADDLVGHGQGHGNAVHQHQHQHRGGGGAGGAAVPVGAAASALGGWALMSVAMMTPAALPMARHVAFRSLRARRSRAVLLFVAAYLGVWVAFGVPVLALVAAVRGLGLGDRALVATALLAAAAWEVSPWKRRALGGCHRTLPLPPVGRRADVACLRSGLLRAGPCVVSCGGLMLAMAAIGHTGALAVVVMAGVSVLAVSQARLDRDRPLRRRQALQVATVLALAALAAALGL
jgi:predicted metal-binding membrane protein